MEPANASLTAEFTVPVYDLDSRSRLSVQGFTNYLFEAAGRHAHRLGVDVPRLEPLGLTWMISRLRVGVSALPGWGETVRVTTWPSSHDSLHIYRDFELRDGAGRPIGAALSAWLLIERGTRRPARVPDLIRALPFPDRPPALAGGFSRFPRAEEPGRGDEPAGSGYRVRAGDVDANHHANYGSYLSWILDSLPPQILPEHRLAELEIHYRAECNRGERVLVRTVGGEAGAPDPSGEPSSGPVFRHRVVRPADGRELALARTAWIRDPAP